jgi:hypothetical protein
MLFAAYAIFLALIVLAARTPAPRREGSPWRPVGLTLSVASLALFASLAPQQEGASLGSLLVAAGVSGSALYGIGAAVWTGMAGYRLRELGWVLVALAFGFPSTLTLVLPFVGLLAFPLAHISPYGPADHVRRAAA